MNEPILIALREWQSVTPAEEPRLRGLSFDGMPAARELAGRLAQSGITIVERRDGLAVETKSFVGMVSVGPVRLAIEPKIDGRTLLTLVRYAYGLRHLELYREHAGNVAARCFQDVLIEQLTAEVGELIARGLHRRYQERRERLALPRGRIDFREVVAGGGVASAALPCRHHTREEDCFPNQVLLAGLRVASGLANDPDLATRVRQLARQMSDRVARIELDATVYARIDRERNRLLAAYQPAFDLIELLARDKGVAVKGEEEAALPGFLFDMNRFFERLVQRFLERNLADCHVDAQQVLRLYAWEPASNPRRRENPEPRPDFVVTRKGGGETVVLDAKYRDLWAKPLPRDMLYQLTVYSIGASGRSEATILYPTTAGTTREQRIAIREPVAGRQVGAVALRPVPLMMLGELLTARPTPVVVDKCRLLAEQLAFGGSSG